MMRAMYSGVAGLKTHQTKMDVIGNNIANVNTVAFKSSSTTFSEIMYQRVSSASGPNANGRGGINAKQIGLGVNMASTTVNISSPGATQTTGGAFDLAITGDNFFVVNNGSGNLFTKAGAFDIDEAGSLVMKSTGYYVMGWQVDPETQTIRKDTVSPLQIMRDANLTSPPEATTLATCSGVLDKHDKNVNSKGGYMMSLDFYDALGYVYTARFSVKSTNTDGDYTVELTDILNSTGQSIKDEYDVANLDELVSFGTQSQQTERLLLKLADGVHYDPKGAYDPAQGIDRRYTKSVVFPTLASNFDETRISGFTYPEEKGEVVAGGATGFQTTVNAKASFSAEEMAKYYGVVFNETAKQYEKNGNAITTAEDWRKIVLGEEGNNQNTNIKNFQFKTVDVNSGSMEFSFDQTFEVDSKLVANGNTPTLDETGNAYLVYIDQAAAYDGLNMNEEGKEYSFDVAGNGTALVTISSIVTGNILKLDTETGLFVSIGGQDAVTLDFKEAYVNRSGQTMPLGNFSDISIDFTGVERYDNGGVSTMGTDAGGLDGIDGKGKKLGDLIGLSVSQDGTIWGNYDNGNTTLLGQIATAKFANPAGLEKMGENCYQTTLNSGEFDGIGVDITADGGKMSSGVLEMSNVDLSTEFTEMITTQRGFQANSRIITTSDTLLEELINLKR